MKKLALFFAAALVSLAASAHTLNNPVGTDGRYIVKYDCENGKFAAANDFEIDETFTFALDITGTWLADWIKGTPTVEGASRGVACNFWTSQGDVQGDIKRFKQINGNIWGMTLNLTQAKADAADWSKALMKDSVLYIYGQVFGFEYTADNAGASWWQWADQEVATTQADGADCMFATLPYTGTKTSAEFFGDEVGDGIYGFALKGYASPCAISTAIEEVAAEEVTNKVIENGQLYLIHEGVKYNVLGAQVK